MKKISISILFLGLFAIQVLAQKAKPQTTTAPAKAEKIDRSKRPVPGPAPEIKLGKIESFTLENGLKVFVVENHKLPRVAFSIQLDNDPVLEKDAVGVSQIAGELLATGTKTRTKDDIDNAIDMIGASIYPGSDGIYASSLKKHQEKLLDLMSDIIMNSNFKQEELDKIKTRTISSLATQKDEPDAIANNVKSALIYGKNHPYGEITTEKTVENVSLEKCNMFYKVMFRPNVAYMGIVGDITLDEAKALVTKYFAKWEKAPVPQAVYEKPKEPGKRRVAVINKAGAVQSVVSITYALDLKPNSEDLVKARVVNNILGGNASSRLFTNLREKHGWTYGAYSKLNDDELIGSFNAYAKVRNVVTDSSVAEMLNEFKRLRSEKVDEKELQEIKNYMTGNFAISLENPQTIANMAIAMDRYNLPKDYYSNYLKNIAAVTPDDVLMMAQKYIRPDNCWIVVVGNKEEVSDKLKRFSTDGKLEFYDNYANDVKAAKAVPEGVTATSVVDNYIQAIGGAAKLGKVKDITMKMTASVQGMNLELVSSKKAPDKYLSTMSMNGMVMQKQVYDGKRGKESGMQGTKEIEGDDLKALAEEATLFGELKYKTAGYKLELKGIEEVNGKDAYVLEVTNPLNKKETSYYDVVSGLKVKSVQVQEVEQAGPMTQTTELTNYKEVGGIKFPHDISQTVGPQALKITVNSIEMNTKLKDEVFKVE